MFLMLLAALTAVLACGALLIVVVPVVVESLVTRRRAPIAHGFDPLTRFGLAYEGVAFQAKDGLTLRGWFIPTQQAHAPAIAYAHGAGQDQRSGLSLVPALHQAGYNVLLFSYRDCGHSDGDGRGMTYGHRESEDVDSAVRFLRQVKGVQDIGVIGYSVGATSALLSASRNPDVQAVVAVAPFASPAEVWAANRPAFLPPSALAWTRRIVEWHKRISFVALDLTALVAHIAPRPLLLIHGSRDEWIPFWQAQRLYAAAGEPKTLWLLEGETHDSVRTRGLERHMAEVVAFFAEALQSGGPSDHGAQQR